MATGWHGNGLVTVSAAVRLIPRPPALVLSRNTKMSDLKNDHICLMNIEALYTCGYKNKTHVITPMYFLLPYSMYDLRQEH